MNPMYWQWIVAGLLLVVAVIYIFRTLRKNFSGEHDCPDCDVPVSKVKKHPLPGHLRRKANP
jgi:hypothetical protein